jgi:hypothetical protein
MTGGGRGGRGVYRGDMVESREGGGGGNADRYADMYLDVASMS